MLKKPEDLTPACYVLLKHALPSYKEFYDAAVLNASTLASRSMFAVLKYSSFALSNGYESRVLKDAVFCIR